jgi:hypothetical protein
MRSRRIIHFTSDRGAALLAALCFTTVLAIVLGSYLTVCQRTLELSSRSLRADVSVQLAELGMEDALLALNKGDWASWTITGSTVVKTTSGFAYGNGITGAVTMTISNYDGSSGSSRTLSVTGTSTSLAGASSRTLTATSTRAPLFVNAAAATTGLVKMTAAGTSSLVDSYDSSVGLYTAQTPGYSAILSAGNTGTAAATVQLNNAQVKGYAATLSTGPSYSTSAKLVGPTTPGTTKIDPARISTSPYQPIFDIRTITGAGATLSNPANDTTTTIGTPGAAAASIYYTSGIDLRGTSTKIIVDGPVKLVVSGPFYVGLYAALGGTPNIEVTTNGTLEVFAGGDIAIYGGGIDNKTKAPERVAIYGTNTLTVPDMNTTIPFYGVIYTPTGDFKVASNNAVYGAIVARNVTFTGTAPVVHYDLNLRNQVFAGIDTPYAVSNWRESTVDN